MKIRIAFKEPLKLGALEWYLDLNVIGTGKIDDPFIFSPPKNVYSGYRYDKGTFSLSIEESKSYCELRNYELRGITLVDCVNMTISKSDIRTVKLIKCSNILIKNSIIRKLATLENCSNILIKKSTMDKKLYIESSYTVDLVDSKIKKFKALTSEEISASNCLFGRIKKGSQSSSLMMVNSEVQGRKYAF